MDEEEEYEDNIHSTRMENFKKWAPPLQLILMTQLRLQDAYYMRFVHKIPCFTSKLTGYQWMRECLDSPSDVRCFNAFRMEKNVFMILCNELEDKYGLKASRRTTVIEKVGIFLTIVAQADGFRQVCERFQHSSDTISRVFHQVLEAFVGRKCNFNGFVRSLLESQERNFTTIPDKINSQDRYKVFKGAIGCIDGVHMMATIPEKEQIPYFGRKKYCSFNVMACCDFDMYFTFVSAGWEGSAHDARVFDHAIRTLEMNFPHPPAGRYYLVDKGYPDKRGYLVPYSKVNYHKSQFGREAPQNQREGFNRIHSSLRTTIERCFGVLKKRWHILTHMPPYKIPDQIDIILVCFALHNFILKHKLSDSYIDFEYVEGVFTGWVNEGEDDAPEGMSTVRDAISHEIWANRKEWLY